ncbi:hypothetical protein [Ideonella sp. A 288]|uniref:hypothetical protein n=1 Tax=Ideonella sp. A 288 TaxID=1962181 RepID=UPI001F3800F6|nr:hypothetical protein [Ideonella sp. A 288]
MNRVLRYEDAVRYCGLKRRSFDAAIRPRVRSVRVGTSLLFDRRELDRALDALFNGDDTPKLMPKDMGQASHKTEPQEQNDKLTGRPNNRKGIQTWAVNNGASTPTTTRPGRSTNIGAALDFASVASKVLAKRKAG